ncbi:alcohol dehydrogenase-like 3 protein [Tanacetum coccineum]
MAILKNNNNVSHSKDANTRGKVITCKDCRCMGPALNVGHGRDTSDPPQKMRRNPFTYVPEPPNVTSSEYTVVDSGQRGQDRHPMLLLKTMTCSAVVVSLEISEILEGGVDFSFECAGNLDVLREAFLSTHEGWGLTVLLGIHSAPKTLPIHPMELFEGRRIIGSVFGDFKGKTQLPQFAKQCMHGR